MLIIGDIIQHSKIYGSAKIDEVTSWVAPRMEKLSTEETVDSVCLLWRQVIYLHIAA